MNINLHINRLVLDGIDLTSHEQQMLQASVTAELSRLLSSGGLAPHLAQGIALDRLNTNGIYLAGHNPTQLGQRIAHSVYKGIGHE